MVYFSHAVSSNLDHITERLAAFVGDVDSGTKKGRKRAAILDAATQMFASKGYRGTSMDELASSVGVAKGTLYLYFPKKVDLIIACAAREKMQWIPRLHAILVAGDATPEVRLKQWVASTLLLPSESPFMSRLIDGGEDLAEFMAEYPPELAAEGEAMAAELLGPLLEAVAGGEHRWSSVELADRVTVVRSLAHLASPIRHDWARPGMSAERFAMILADLVVDGLRARSPTRQGASA